MKNLVFNLRTAKAQAEGCAKVTKSSRMAKILTTLTLLLTLGVGQMWGVSICKTGTTYIYLDRTNMTSWTTSGNTYLVWRYDNSAYRAQTSNIANTKLALWYGSTGWDNITHIGYMYGSWGASGSDSWSNITDWATDYTNSYNGSFGFSSGNYSVISATGSSKNWTLSPTYMGNTGYSDMNKTVTLRAKVSTNGGSTYAETNTPGALTASSYKFGANNTCSTQDATTTASLSAGSSYTTFTAGYTANTSVTAASVTGYDFVGWYEGSTLVLDGSRTGTMNPHGAVTLYAYYKVKQYTVSYGVNSSTRWGSIKLNSSSAVTTTSSSTLNHGTAISFTATPNSGYLVEGWYSDAACSSNKKLQSGGTSYNAGTLTAAKTVYVKFMAISLTSVSLSKTTASQGVACSFTASFTHNLPTDNSYQYAIRDFVASGSSYGAGYKIGATYIGASSITTGTMSYTWASTGTYKTQIVILKGGSEVYSSGDLTITVSSGASASDPEWSMYNDNTNLGTFTNNGDNTYTLVVTIPAGGYNLTHYNNDQGFVGVTGAESLTTERTLVNNNGRIAWQDGAGTFRITIRKDGSDWKISAVRVYSVTYNGNGKTGGSVPTDDTYYTSGSTVTVKSNSGSLVRTNYSFGGWNTNASGTGTNYTAGSGTFSITADTELFAKWNETMHTVTVSRNSTTLGTVSTSSVSAGVSTASTTITATPVSGATFTGWTIPSGVTLASGTTSSASITINATADSKTITANFAETTYTVNVALADASQSGGTTSPNGDTQVGAITPVQITAPTPNTGFSSTGRWTTTGGVTVANETANPTTITATSAGTVRWTFDEDLTSTWYVEGDASGPFLGWKADATTMLQKKTGYSTSNDVYWTATVTAAQSTPTDAQWEFKIYNSAGADETAKWYGWGTESSYYWLKNSNNSLTLSNSTNNVRFKPYLAGEYEFHFNTSTKVLTVTWPSVNQVQIYGATPTDATNTNNFDLGAAVSNVRSKTLSLNANTTYRFKIVSGSDFYGFDSGTFTRSTSTSSNSLTLSTSGGDMTLTTDYAGDYTFKFNESTKVLSIDFPEAYKITWGVGTVPGNKYAITCKKYGTETAVVSNSTWIKSGDKVTFYAGNNDADKVVKDGYTWRGYYSEAAGTTQLSNQTGYSPVINADNMSFYACFYENDYTVTVNAGTGGKVNSLSSTTITGHVATLANLPTATADPGYYFVNWTTTAGTLTNSTSATTGKINGLTSTATVTANFAPIWTIAGLGGDWDVNKLPLTNTYVDATVNYAYLDIDTLRPNTTYYFKAIQRSQGSPVWWRAENASDEEIKYTNSNTRLNMVNTTGDNFTLKTAGAGTYTFDINLDGAKHPIKVHFPTSYTVTFGYGTGGSTVTATVEDATTITTGQYAAEGKDITFTQTPATGYEFKGWYDAESGGSAISCMSSDNVYDEIADNISVYAQYNPKTYTVTLTNSGTGYGSGGQANLTATYDAAFPSITLPTAAQGYGFMGYWSAANGEGTQFTDAEGHLLANIEDYSDADGNWKYDGTTTLYAYYKKAEITDVVLNAGIFEPAEVGDPDSYVTADPVIEPTPTPTTKLCWELRYSNDNKVEGRDPISVSGNKVKFLLNGLAAGGYKIHVELRTGSTCGAGTLLSSYDKSFSIASDHIVTVQYKCGDFTLKSPTSVGGKPLDWSEVIEAASITGYTFNHWEAGEGVTIKDDEGEDKTTSTDATIQIKAIYDSKLTAVYTKKRVIYFYNTLGWSNVYVYFYKNDSYWGNDNQGSGANTTYTFTGTPYSEGLHGQMLPIEEGSSIYYFDAEAAGVNASYTNVVFTELAQHGCNYFYNNNKVVRRGDYQSTTLPMFVPLANQTPEDKNGGTAKYYNKGYWMNYPENTGYTLRIYNTWNADNATGASREYMIPFSTDKKMPLKQDVEINFSGETWFLIYRNDGNYLQGSHTFKQNDHGDKAMTSTSEAGSASKMKVISDAEGIYTFTLSFHGNGANPEVYSYYVNVEFPAAVGDYRIVYQDNATWSQSTAHDASWNHPSRVIPKIKGDATEDKKDTVSFFISVGSSPTMKFQKIESINATTGAVTWTDVASGSITIPSSITESGVYNFIVTQPVGGASISLEKAEPYTGNFYIRTDGAGSTKWDNYQTSDHQMTYTEFSMSAANSFGDKYSHYFMHWSPGGTNIKFVVANDYSPCISDTLENDLHDWGNLNAGGQLKKDGDKSAIDDIYSANIRFMYNYKTNKISRAYVSSSTNASRLFLVLRGNEVIKDENGTAVSDQGVTNGAILSDKENWIYERILYIKPNSRFKLFACYAEASPTQAGAQYFRGAYDSDNFTTNDNSVILISGSGSYQKARVLYDFKTNRLVCAWLPSDEPIDETLDIDADVMVIRDHQEAAECITFSGSGSLTDVKTVYGAMKFNRWTLNNRYRGKGGVEDNNKDHCDSPEDIAEYHGILPAGEQKSVYERSLYFISFPFDVKVSEIFGFGTYGKHWVLEYYDGLNRAKNGYWIDSPANWKYVTPSMAKTYELKAYEGYILCLSLGRMAYDNTEFWANNISNVELYFPSKTPMTNIQTTNVNISGLNEIAGDPYRCTINREGEDGDRRIKDSYWRCLGVPSYDMYAGTLTSDGSTVINWQTDYSTFPFLYAWNMNDNTLTPQSTNRFSFKPMHAYLTQIGTAIYWKNVSATPASVIARQVEEPAEYNWRLTLNNGENLIDQTYVRMSTDEVITNEFDFGQDLSKELNTGRSDIYSFIGNERAAANSLQMNTETTTIVPLGLNIEATGDYTFSIPDGTNGIGITLIDEETGIRTSLSALDYTVELAAGDYTERFWLEISPVKGAETGIDPGVDARENGVRKVMIDGILYIVKDGKMYDARGARVE